MNWGLTCAILRVLTVRGPYRSAIAVSTVQSAGLCEINVLSDERRGRDVNAPNISVNKELLPAITIQSIKGISLDHS